MRPRSTLLLNRTEISSLLTPDDYIRAVERAFEANGKGLSLSTGLLHIDSHGGEFHIKSSGLDLDGTYVGVKCNGAFWQNRERGLPYVHGGILLFDGETGAPLAIMDSVEITIQRTAAATAVAAKYLARPDSRVVTVCGTGTQGRAQLRFLARVLPVERVYAFGRRTEAAERYASEMGAELGIEVIAVPKPAGAARQSDVIVTCTPARAPLLGREEVAPGTFVAAVGSDNPQKQELDPRLLAASKVVPDITEQCARVGELHHALVAGVMQVSDVHAELGEVVAGKRPGRTSEAEITLFDSTGTALQDVAAAALAYERALAAGRGNFFDLQA
ncbi:MAG TPA: ornithine cyclodeaminase family protein [Longimicrobiaceae bacterium]|nr:ornithine cyclodeaminase family protein [Longimicrobiaceae bacterium]